MLDAIIRFSIQNKLIIGLLTLGLVVWGGYSLSRLPIDALPDITNNQVQVITPSPALSATDVERLISFPVEQAMANLPDLVEVRSFPRFGLSVVTIVFADGVDLFAARQQVAERLTSVRSQIPTGTGDPELGPISTGLGEIYQYVVQPKPGYETRYGPTELRSIQDWIVRRQLLGTKGVADVSSFGGYLKQYEVAIDPARLRASDVSVDELFTALQQNNQNTGGAYIDRRPNAYFIRSEGLITNLADIAKIVVRQTPGGIPIRVGDVAQVRLGHAIRYGAMVRGGEVVLMLTGANAAQVIGNVKARVAQIEKSLPEGVEIRAYLDRTDLVNRAIHTVEKNMLEGLLIVIFVLVLLLGNLRAGLVVASVIPLTYSRWVVGGSVVLLAGSLWLFSRLGGEFIPQLDEGDFAVETRLLTGSSLAQTIHVSGQIGTILHQNFPEVRDVISKIGSGEIPTDPVPVEAIDIMILLKDRAEWTSAASREELAEKMLAKLQQIPGVNYSFLQPIQMRFSELISGVKQDIAVKLFGEDLGVLADYATRIGRVAQTVPGAEDIFVEPISGLSQIVVRYDRDALARFGVSIGEANRYLQTAFAGSSAGVVYSQVILPGLFSVAQSRVVVRGAYAVWAQLNGGGG